jgi:hypothetical protein
LDIVIKETTVEIPTLVKFVSKLTVKSLGAIRDILRTVTTLMNTKDASFQIVLTNTTREAPLSSKPLMILEID